MYIYNTMNPNRWRVLVTIDADLVLVTLHDKTYSSFKEISEDLNLSLQQVGDISINRKNKFKNNKFRYSPLTKIDKLTQK